MALYIVTGFIFAYFMEWVHNNSDEGNTLNLMDRIVIVLFWPLVVLGMVIHFFE